MENKKLLDIKDLRVSFFTPAGEVKAVNGISYSLDYSQVIGIVGESGSGKSVSAYSLLGLVDSPGRVVGGSVSFDGKDLLAMNEYKTDAKSRRLISRLSKSLGFQDKEIRNIRGREISMIFQDPMTCLNPVYTIGDQICEALHLYFDISHDAAMKRAQELLELVGINDSEKRLKQYPHEFSGGMRQRAMIAMALAGEPKLLIADEPTTALDVTIQAQILELLVDIKKRINMSIMMITHDLGIVAGLADKVIVMYGGTIVEEASVDEIFSNPVHPYTKGLINSLPKLENKSEKLQPISGTPIDLLNAPKGCPFAPRCDSCLKVCIENQPPYFEAGKDHYSSCWLMHEHAKKEAV